MYCIIEAMIGADSGVQLLEPVIDGVPDMVGNTDRTHVSEHAEAERNIFTCLPLVVGPPLPSLFLQ